VAHHWALHRFTSATMDAISSPPPHSIFHHGIRRRGGTIFWGGLAVRQTAGPSGLANSPQRDRALISEFREAHSKRLRQPTKPRANITPRYTPILGLVAQPLHDRAISPSGRLPTSSLGGPVSDNRQWKGIAPGGPAIKRRCASLKLRSPLGAENITVKGLQPTAVRWR
jgi:hypothetical protein